MKQPELIIEDMLSQPRKINADRKELRSLADDIHTNGLQHPILVMDGIVIDGLKRIEAFKLLGRARIPALITSNFGEGAIYLKQVHGGANLGSRREMEIVEQMEPARLRFHKRRFNKEVLEADAKQPWGNTIPSRDLMAGAISRSVSYTEAIMYILKVAEENEEARRRLALIKKGEDTVHATRNWLYARRLQPNLNVSAADMIAAAERGFQDIQTTLEALSKYGSMLALSIDDRVAIVERAEKVRKQLFAVVKEIRTGLNMEAKEGKRDEH